eukprot:m.40491 g.40491  ORF g.40491 m.40491 type:complete len:240 (-) comp18508_c0_seq2:271-990(-)
MSVLRKLQALGYPQATSFDCNDGGAAFKNLIVWLEDTKICFYAIDERQPLRQIHDPTWNSALAQYLVDVGCPYKHGSVPGQQLIVLDWMLGHAIALEYNDNVDMFSNVKPRNAAALPTDTRVSSESMQQLTTLLKLPTHQDENILLQVIASILNAKFTPSSVSANIIAKDEPKLTLPLDSMALGFSTGDTALDRAAKVLRLLHIADLRDLQTRVNELIVKVQALTADPKTNARLGKVGY